MLGRLWRIELLGVNAIVGSIGMRGKARRVQMEMRCQVVDWIVSLSIRRYESREEERLVGDRKTGRRMGQISRKWGCADLTA
jgi:hypothetical protein